MSAWVLSKTGVGQRLQVIIVIALVLGGVFFYGRSIGSKAGKQEVREAVVDQDVKDWKTEKAQLLDELDSVQRTMADALEEERAARMREVAAAARSAETNRRLSDLERRRSEGVAAVARVSDDALESQIQKTIGLRHEDAIGLPGLILGEQRVILNVLVDYPVVKEENETFKEKVTALGDQVDALEGRVDAMETRQRATEKERDLWKDYGDQMDVHYRTAVNAVGRRKRSAKCLFLWKCTDKKLTIPTPEELRKTRPETE